MQDGNRNQLTWIVVDKNQPGPRRTCAKTPLDCSIMYEYRNKTLLEQLKLCKNTICKELDLKTKTKTLELLFKNSYKTTVEPCDAESENYPCLEKRHLCKIYTDRN